MFPRFESISHPGDSRIVRGHIPRTSLPARERAFDARKFPCNDLEDCGRHGHGRVIYAARKSPRSATVRLQSRMPPPLIERLVISTLTIGETVDWISRGDPSPPSPPFSAHSRKRMDNWEMKSWIRELDIVEMNNYWTMKVGVMVELCEFVARLDVIKCWIQLCWE